MNFNEYVAVFVSKKDLRRIFDIIDRNKNGVVGMDDIKNVSQLTMAPENNAEEAPEWQDQSENLTGNEILLQQQLNDLYEELKNKIETKNITMEAIVF